jgi:hypothetical protein
MRGCVFHLQLLLVLTSAVIFRFESRWTHDHILLSLIRDFPQPGGPGPRIFIPRNRVLTFISRILGFVVLTDVTLCSQVEESGPIRHFIATDRRREQRLTE